MEEPIEKEDPTNPPAFERRYNPATEGIVNTLKWVIVALILAFIGRTFIMEAFRIPTGSMAETLRGAHFHGRCVRCGFKFDVGAENPSTAQFREPQCPNCAYLPGPDTMGPVQNGDRIFVLKCLYHYFEPKQWDVVVFKYPPDPTENYIKRMIAGPGDTLEIVDGDIYIDGEISRKPPKVQDEFWMLLFDNDYQPIDMRAIAGNSGGGSKTYATVMNKPFVSPFTNEASSKWDLGTANKTVFKLESEADELSTFFYDPSVFDEKLGKDFRAIYGYNHRISYPTSKICSDLMIRYSVTNKGSEGAIGAELKKYETSYRGIVDFSGKMTLIKVMGSQITELASKQINSLATGKSKQFQFSNIDHMLTLDFGSDQLVHDLGTGKEAAGPIPVKADEDRILPYTTKFYSDSIAGVKVMGQGQLEIIHTALYRDMYYIGNLLRPRDDEPFTLGADEFFMSGDNSANSQDSRLWSSPGKGNTGRDGYRVGIVHRDHLMGKAFFLYWGDAFKPLENLLPIIPNFSQMKVIPGSNNETVVD